jgi:hypothetical protein
MKQPSQPVRTGLLAHVPTHRLDSFEKRRHGVQGDARVALPDDCIGLIQDSVQFQRAKARLGEPGLSFASNFIVAGGEK